MTLITEEVLKIFDSLEFDKKSPLYQKIQGLKTKENMILLNFYHQGNYNAINPETDAEKLASGFNNSVKVFKSE